MKAGPGQKIKIGVFTIAGIGLLLTGLFIIGANQNMFDKSFRLHGEFRNVGGLIKGNMIRFNGINVGTVEDVGVVNDSTIRVDMSIRDEFHPYIKEDAVASIGTDGLMGDKLIVIAPGDGSNPRIIASNGRIATNNPIDFEKSMAKVNRIASNLEIMSGSLAQITSQVSSGKGTIGKLLYDDGLSRGLENTVAQAQQTLKSAHSTMTTMDGTLKQAGHAVVAVEATVKTAQEGAEGFKDNMEALKHNFLLKGYFKKHGYAGFKRNTDSVKVAKRELRQQKREERKARRNGRNEDRTGVAADK